jgi:hypothetical protein
MVKDVIRIMPVSADALFEAWQQKYMEGCQVVIVEVPWATLACLALNMGDIAALNPLMTQHAANFLAHKKDLVVQQLERDSFDLLAGVESGPVQTCHLGKQRLSCEAAKKIRKPSNDFFANISDKIFNSLKKAKPC